MIFINLSYKKIKNSIDFTKHIITSNTPNSQLYIIFKVFLTITHIIKFELSFTNVMGYGRRMIRNGGQI